MTGELGTSTGGQRRVAVAGAGVSGLAAAKSLLDEALRYLYDYADAFSLREHLRLETSVDAIWPDSAGGWELSSHQGTALRSERFDAVLVASGRYQDHAAPRLPGADKFRGRVLHSSEYKNPEPFTGKKGGRGRGRRQRDRPAGGAERSRRARHPLHREGGLVRAALRLLRR